MLKLKPDLVVAFPGNAGTRNMIMQAEKAGVPVKVVTDG
jgi:ABC-type Fe3+-hydroxamate transport system substrate-binding protein